MQNTNYETCINLIAHMHKNGLTANEVGVEIGPTPTIIQANGNFNNLPLLIYGKAVNKVVFDHGITASILRRLYTLLETPHGIYKTDSAVALKGSIVVVTTEMVANGTEHMIVALQPNINVGHKQINRVASVYGKPPGVVQGWVTKGLKLYP